MSIRFAAAAAALLFAALPAAAHEYKAGSLEIGHPWSRATPAGAKVAAGYLTVTNAGDADDRLVAATAEVAGKVELHESSEKDGVMSMRPLPDGLAVPAKGGAALKPGGAHLMFLELKRPLVAGERIPGSVTFEKAGVVTVEFAVEKIGATPGGKPAEDHSKHHGG